MADTVERPYHHGDLRRALLAAVVEMIGESGPAALSLRELARRAGVSHAAPAHHFGDKTGLLTAVAVQGYELLAAALAAAARDSAAAKDGAVGAEAPHGDDSLLEIGVAYVRFAVDHRAHFDVMFQPDLYRADDSALIAARQRAGESLRAGLATLPPAAAAGDTAAPASAAGLAAWSIVHGFAALWLGGAFPVELGDDPERAARSVIRLLFDRAG